MPELGRRIPTDWRHVERHPARLALEEQRITKPTPVVAGTNWHRSMFRPVKLNGRWWIGVDENGKELRPDQYGPIEGGHAYTFLHHDGHDLTSWWRQLNQRNLSACVGYAGTRAMMLVDRRRFDPVWLWNKAKERDEWADTNPGDNNGTSVRAAMDVLRTDGHVRVTTYKGVVHPYPPDPKYGISENVWCTSPAEVLEVLGSPFYWSLGAAGFLNSWGEDYPHITYMPLGMMDRLIQDYGEMTNFIERD